MHVLIFSGTTEGCQLAQRLGQCPDLRITVCSATEYGSSLVVENDHVHSIARRLDQAGMENLMRSEAVDMVVDATHPFAEEVTKNIAGAAKVVGVERLRLVRAQANVTIANAESEHTGELENAHAGKCEDARTRELVDAFTGKLENTHTGKFEDTNTNANAGTSGDRLWISVANAAEAARVLSERTGNVLLTTGSKELGTFTAALPDFRDRLYVRVLPLASSVEHARELGVPLEHVIAMKGPFSQALNEALIREFSISVLVTKESGETGGFAEKINATRACGIEAVVIRRPIETDGASLEEVLHVIKCAADRKKGCRKGGTSCA